MAPKQTLLALAFIAAALAQAAAVEYVVGDDQGWNLKVNYTQWAAGKQFFVGDKLVFNYDREKHNVLRVGGADFQACNVSTLGGALTSGKDVVPLMTTGRKWYVCGVAGHCESGMKLRIVVQEAVAGPAPPPSSGGIAAAAYPAAIASALVAVAAMVFG